MSRYGWSSSRDQISPYSSMSGSGPAVTDEDFSYITSQDLEDPSLRLPETRPRARSRSSRPDPEDDVLLIKNKGIIYPTQFPAYAIGDGKLRVVDVRNRICTMMDLPQRFANRIKLLYKGRQLKDASAPVREYGVKNKSEVMAVMPEGEVAGSTSGEEEVIVDGSKSRRRKKKKNKKSSDKAESSDSPSQPAPANATGPMAKLDELRAEFTDKWLPLCRDFIAAPPTDPKKKDDEHRKLSESVLQQILLKLDGVETDGNPEIRARRKEQVKDAQAILKELDLVVGKERPGGF
ncbi:BAG domain-containing protein [Sarocladium implicatum]|nr:BAG domain-containing protein [Sarocladium implicatum]